MAENTIQRVIQIDTSASEKTVRELTAEVEQARKKLAELQAGTESYAAAAQRAAAAEKQFNDALAITEDSDANRMATVEEMAAAEARQAEEVNKIVDALVSYRDMGYDVSASLQGLSRGTEQAVRSTQALDDAVNRLRDSGSELIETLIADQQQLAAVRAQRKALNKEIAQGLITETQAREVKGELIAQEGVYKARISENRQALSAMTKEVVAAEGSYDQMSQTLGRLRNTYRGLSKEQRNSPMGADMLRQIEILDAELKQLDASMGNYQRNVGNYDSAVGKLSPTLGRLLESVKGLSNGTMSLTGVIQGGTAALKALTGQALAFIATPLGATIMAIVVAYQAVKNAIDDLNETIEENVDLMQQQEREQTRAEAWRIAEQKALEENAKGWIKAKGAIEEAWQAVKIFYKYTSALRFGKLWEIVTGVGETKEALANIEDMKKQLYEMQVGDPDKGILGTIEKVGQLEIQIASLRAKAVNQEAYSEEEREKYLREALEKNKQVYVIKRQELDLQLKIAEAQHNATPDSREFEQKWAKLRSRQYELAEEEANAERMLTRSLNKFTTDSTIETAKRAANERVKAEKNATEANEKVLRDTLKLQQGLRKETLENELLTAKENYQQDLAEFNKTVKEKNISEEVAAAYRTALAEKNEADIAKIRKKYRDLEHNELVKDWDEEQKQAKQQEANVKKAFSLQMGDLERGAARETAEAKRDITDPQALEQELQNIQQRLYDKQVELIDQTLQGVSTNSDLFVELSNQRADLEIKNIERVQKAEEKARKQKEKEDELDKKRKQQTLAATASFLDSMSQLVGEDTKAGKALAVSGALISTYLSAQQAYQAAFMPIPTPASPVLGAINMAAAIASGLMNVKSILSVNENGTTSVPAAASTPAVVTPPAVIEQVPLTRTLTSASEEERLNQMASPQRVYVVYDDIAQAGRNVHVQQTESTF